MILYPVDTIVELSNGEKAKVVKNRLAAISHAADSPRRKFLPAIVFSFAEEPAFAIRFQGHGCLPIQNTE